MKMIPTKELIEGVRKALQDELFHKMVPNPKNVRYLSTSLLRLETVLKMEIDQGQRRVALFGDLM